MPLNRVPKFKASSTSRRMITPYQRQKQNEIIQPPKGIGYWPYVQCQIVKRGYHSETVADNKLPRPSYYATSFQCRMLSEQGGIQQSKGGGGYPKLFLIFQWSQWRYEISLFLGSLHFVPTNFPPLPISRRISGNIKAGNIPKRKAFHNVVSLQPCCIMNGNLKC